MGAFASAVGMLCDAMDINTGCNYHAGINDRHSDYKGEKYGEDSVVVGRSILCGAHGAARISNCDQAILAFFTSSLMLTTSNATPLLALSRGDPVPEP